MRVKEDGLIYNLISFQNGSVMKVLESPEFRATTDDVILSAVKNNEISLDFLIERIDILEDGSPVYLPTNSVRLIFFKVEITDTNNKTIVIDTTSDVVDCIANLKILPQISGNIIITVTNPEVCMNTISIEII